MRRTSAIVGARRADRHGALQHHLQPAARPPRPRRPDRRPVARHRRPRPPGRARLSRRLTPSKASVDTTVSRARGAVEPLAAEIGELGGLVSQLADTVAAHEQRLQRSTGGRAARCRRRRRKPSRRCRRAAGAERERRRATARLAVRGIDRDGVVELIARRGRRQPHRSLSAADRHAAAAQGALLRGDVAAAHRRRRGRPGRRLPRRTPRPPG